MNKKTKENLRIAVTALGYSFSLIGLAIFFSYLASLN